MNAWNKFSLTQTIMLQKHHNKTNYYYDHMMSAIHGMIQPRWVLAKLEFLIEASQELPGKAFQQILLNDCLNPKQMMEVISRKFILANMSTFICILNFYT